MSDEYDDGIPDSVYRQVVKFLYTEAELLDSGRYTEWLGLLTHDVVYKMPLRKTRERAVSSLMKSMSAYDEDYKSFEMRIKRLETQYAWAEDPPSRTRRFITNIRIETAEKDSPQQVAMEARVGKGSWELKVRSYVILFRNRGDLPTSDIITAERIDRLRRVDGTWKLVERLIEPDQSVIPTHNLAFWL